MTGSSSNLSLKPLDFLRQLAKAVDVEHDADLKEMELIIRRSSPATIQNEGLGLISLQITATRTGLGGKCLVDLEPHTPGVVLLPVHKLRPGDIVSVQAYEHNNSASNSASKIPVAIGTGTTPGSTSVPYHTGVIHRVTDSKICLICEVDPSDDVGGRVQITKLVNEVTHKRLAWVLGCMIARFDGSSSSFTSISSLLIDVLLSNRPPRSLPSSDSSTFLWLNENLNLNQKAAVRLALNADPVALIHGPPGTGKTHTLVEIIRQLVVRGKRVLVCGPSNISVDNLVERLVPHKLPIVRVGHVSRLLPAVISHSLDICVRNSDGGQLVADIVKEMDKLLASVRKSKSRSERRDIYSELKILRKELKSREKKVVDEVLKDAKVVCTTLIGAGGKKFNTDQFDVVIIDECAQALEPECWLALLRAPRAILAGDHLQLPPTIKTDPTTNPLSTTLFERIMNSKYGAQVSVMLTVQYRMHADIMRFSSIQLYNGKLEADESVAGHTLGDLNGVDNTNEEARLVAILMDTAGCDLFETNGPQADSKQPTMNETSKCNQGEAELVVSHVQKLIHLGVPGSEIVVITPYSAQVALIRDLLRKGPNKDKVVSPDLEKQFSQIEVGSVDGMQGREKHAVVVSLVRSNEHGEVGFLAEPRRLNVAITRARRQLMVICDSDTVGKDAFCGALVEYLSEYGELRYPGYE